MNDGQPSSGCMKEEEFFFFFALLIFTSFVFCNDKLSDFIATVWRFETLFFFLLFYIFVSFKEKSTRTLCEQADEICAACRRPHHGFTGKSFKIEEEESCWV